jgi:hypothetical protein
VDVLWQVNENKSRCKMLKRMIVEEVETELPAGDTDKQVIIKLETVL